MKFFKAQNQSQPCSVNHNVIDDSELSSKVKDMTNKLLGEFIKREAGILDENRR